MHGSDICAINAQERAELERLRQAVSTAPSGFISIDEAGAITAWNDAATGLLGWTAAEVAGRPIAETLIPEEMRAAHAAGMARYLATGEPVVVGRPVVLPALHRDGHRVEVELTIWPSWVQGERQFYAFLRDTSAQRAAAERTARQTSALLSTIEAQRAVTAVAYDRELALRVVAEQAISGFPAASGAVVELLDGDDLVYTAVAGTLARQKGLRLVVSGSLSGVAIAGRTVVRSADTETDPRVNRDACREAGIRSMCIAPLYQADEPIGVLKVSSDSPDAFDAADAHQLELLSASLTSALRHAEDYARNAALLAQREVSDNRFRLTFENSPLGLVLASVHPASFGKYLQVNSAMSAITGYSTEELTRMSFADLQHPDDAAVTADTLNRMLAEGQDSIRAEKRYMHKDGHVIWVAVRVAVVRDAEGAPAYVVVQVEDVTAQRATNFRMHQQAKLLELIPAAVIIRTLDGRIRWWNAGAQALYGWSLEAARGMVTHRLLGTAFVDSGSLAEQNRALEVDGHWEGQLQRLTATGRKVTVLCRQVVYQPEPGGDGPGEIQVLEVNTDVTAARAAEQALALKEQRFRAQFTHSAAGQIIGALDGTMIAVNRAFASMAGRRTDEIVGRNVNELFHPDDLAYAHNLVAKLFAGEADKYIQECQVRHVDGHWVDMEATVSLVRDADNSPKNLIIVITDISARRAAERARDLNADALSERNAELEAANQLKLDVIGMLGHEISNPLAAILGYSDLLAEEMPEETPNGRAVAVIGRQAQRLDGIVREVLAMVSIDAGNINAVRQEVALRAEIRQALESTGHGHVPVIGGDARILFHPGHLQQILVNLLSNAAKYAGGATSVRIEPTPAGVAVHIEDNGPGVPDEFRPRLFDRLTRAERDAGTVRGTGLGLYIVRSLARANHGEVRHEPHPAGGSIFVLETEPARPTP
ncbi:PAS domain S-box protein [Actinoplanes sp. NPDC051861]|uniref:PAS domain S-box protein n=1 Tax=Actinoplanes sp. NPDC051861 TaxID=3155170 RepID=UPI003428EBA2